MDRQRLKFLVLGIAVFGTMAAMLLVSVQTSGMYYRTVSEYAADPDAGTINLGEHTGIVDMVVDPTDGTTLDEPARSARASRMRPVWTETA